MKWSCLPLLLSLLASVGYAANNCYLYSCVESHAEGDDQTACASNFETERKTISCPKEVSCLKRITNVGGTTNYLYTCDSEAKADDMGCTKRMHEDMMECYCNDDNCNSAPPHRLSWSLLLVLCAVLCLIHL